MMTFYLNNADLRFLQLIDPGWFNRNLATVEYGINGARVTGLLSEQALYLEAVCTSRTMNERMYA